MSEDDEADSEDEEKLDRTAAPTTNGDNVEEEDEGKETLKKLTIGDIRQAHFSTINLISRWIYFHDTSSIVYKYYPHSVIPFFVC